MKEEVFIPDSETRTVDIVVYNCENNIKIQIHIDDSKCEINVYVTNGFKHINEWIYYN